MIKIKVRLSLRLNALNASHQHVAITTDLLEISLTGRQPMRAENVLKDGFFNLYQFWG